MIAPGNHYHYKIRCALQHWRGNPLPFGNLSKKHVIARSAATWQSPGTILNSAVHFDGWYQEIAPQGYFLALRAQGATPFRARNDI